MENFQSHQNFDAIQETRRSAKAISALLGVDYVLFLASEFDEKWVAAKEFYLDSPVTQSVDLKSLPDIIEGLVDGRKGEASKGHQELFSAYRAGFLASANLRMLKEAIDKLYGELDKFELEAERNWELK